MSYTIKGINDETTTCEQCGKTNLKRVVWLAKIVDGVEHDPVAVGTDCAARLMRGSAGKVKKSEKTNIETIARAASLAKKWLSKGHSPKVVGPAIANKFGYLVDRRQPGKLIIGSSTSNHAVVKIPT